MEEDYSGSLSQFRLQGVEVTEKILGSSSYAEVVEVRYMGLSCVAKRFTYERYCTSTSMLEKWSRRCLEQCKLLGKLRHPNLVQFIGYYLEPDAIFPILVSERLHITLKNCLDKYGLLPDNMAFSIFRDVALALRYLHEHSPSITHRSLSSSKVILTKDMTAKLGGIRVIDDTSLKKPAPPLPTAEAAARRYQKLADTDFIKQDIYLFGLVMLHTITGSELFSSECFESYESISFCEADMVHSLLADIPQSHPLLDLMEKCLSMSPEIRPSTVTLLQKLSQVSANSPPLFNNCLEMLRKIDKDAENCVTMQAQLKKLSPQNSQDISQYNEIERLKEIVDRISAKNIVLQARLSSSSRSSSIEYEDDSRRHSMSQKQLKRQDNQCIRSPLDVSC